MANEQNLKNKSIPVIITHPLMAGPQYSPSMIQAAAFLGDYFIKTFFPEKHGTPEAYVDKQVVAFLVRQKATITDGPFAGVRIVPANPETPNTGKPENTKTGNYENMKSENEKGGTRENKFWNQRNESLEPENIVSGTRETTTIPPESVALAVSPDVLFDPVTDQVAHIAKAKPSVDEIFTAMFGASV